MDGEKIIYEQEFLNYLKINVKYALKALKMHSDIQNLTTETAKEIGDILTTNISLSDSAALNKLFDDLAQII